MLDEAIKKQEKVELKKTLSMPALVFIAVASVLGSGIFLLPAIGASLSGPASILAWIILILVFMYVAACFGELAAMFPTAGGVYEYGKQAYGRFFSFLIGWLAWLIGNITTAMLITGAIKFLIPESSGYIHLGPITLSVTLFKLLMAIFWVVAFNYMAYRGLKTSTIMLVMFASITLTVITSVSIAGFMNFDISNLSPFFIHNSAMTNLTAFIVTLFIIAETFFGLESVLFLAGETKNPEKAIPKALIYAIIIIGILVIMMTVSSLGSMNYRDFSTAELPEVDIVSSGFGKGIANIVPIAIYVVILGAAAGWIVTSPRLILALAEDRLFLEQFKELHKEYATPYKAIIFQACATILFLILGMQGSGYETLLRLLTPIVLIELLVVMFALYVLRKKMPERHRPFRAPFAKTGSIMMSLFFLGLIGVWAFHESGAWGILKLGISFVAVGIPLYLLIEIYHDPKMITEINDITAYTSIVTERFIFKDSEKKEILSLLGDVKGKTLLEYGCNVGTFTVLLAEAVGPMGRIYAVDISKNHIKITQRRYERLVWSSEEFKHGKVHTIHDEMQLHRVHPNIYYADGVVSIGMLSYIQDVPKILKDINRVLPANGKVLFIEFADYFKVIPNVAWLSNNEKIQEYFRQAGFSVHVERRKGRLWNYIYVYGIKSNEDIVYI